MHMIQYQSELLLVKISEFLRVSLIGLRIKCKSRPTELYKLWLLFISPVISYYSSQHALATVAIFILLQIDNLTFGSVCFCFEFCSLYFKPHSLKTSHDWLLFLRLLFPYLVLVPVCLFQFGHFTLPKVYFMFKYTYFSFNTKLKLTTSFKVQPKKKKATCCNAFVDWPNDNGVMVSTVASSWAISKCNSVFPTDFRI